MEIDYMSAVSSMEVTSLKSLDTSLKEWRKEDDTGRLLRCHSKTTLYRLSKGPNDGGPGLLI